MRKFRILRIQVCNPSGVGTKALPKNEAELDQHLGEKTNIALKAISKLVSDKLGILLLFALPMIYGISCLVLVGYIPAGVAAGTSSDRFVTFIVQMLSYSFVYALIWSLITALIFLAIGALAVFHIKLAHITRSTIKKAIRILLSRHNHSPTEDHQDKSRRHAKILLRVSAAAIGTIPLLLVLYHYFRKELSFYDTLNCLIMIAGGWFCIFYPFVKILHGDFKTNEYYEAWSRNFIVLALGLFALLGSLIWIISTSIFRSFLFQERLMDSLIAHAFLFFLTWLVNLFLMIQSSGIFRVRLFVAILVNVITSVLLGKGIFFVLAANAIKMGYFKADLLLKDDARRIAEEVINSKLPHYKTESLMEGSPYIFLPNQFVYLQMSPVVIVGIRDPNSKGIYPLWRVEFQNTDVRIISEFEKKDFSSSNVKTPEESPAMLIQ